MEHGDARQGNEDITTHMSLEGADVRPSKHVITNPIVEREAELPDSQGQALSVFASDDVEPQMGEVSTSRADIFKQLHIVDYNPDSLVGSKGLKVYDDMRNDDQVKAVLSTKKFARLSTPWDIVPASNSAEDIKIAEFVKWTLLDMDGTIEGDLKEILSALDYGYSITEIVWKIVEKGNYKGLIGLKALKTRKPHSFDFKIDEHDNLEAIVQTISAQQIPLNPKKFIVYSYQKLFDNFYGTSDMKAIYRSYWSKDVLIKFWNMWLERYPAPLMIGWYPYGTPKDERDDFFEVLKKMRIGTIATIPDTMEIDIRQNTSTGHEVFQQAIEFHNKSIARGILCPDLLGYTQTTGPGSYALGKKHFDVFMFVLDQMGTDIEEELMYEQLIKRLVDYNFSVERYPKFKFDSLHEDNIEARARIMGILIKAGLVGAEEPWIRDYLELPMTDSKTAKRGAFETSRYEETHPLVPSQEGKQETELDSRIRGNGKDKESFAEGKYRELTVYEEASGVTPQRLEQRIEDWVSDGREMIKTGVEGIIEDIGKQVRRKKIIEGKSYKGIQEIVINPKPIKDAMLNQLVWAYFLGKADAKDEVEKSLGQTLKLSFADASSETFSPKEALEYWVKKKILVRPNEFKAMTDREKTKAFSIAGIIEKDILASMQELLVKAVDQGWSVDQFVFNLQERNIQYTGTAYAVDKTGEPIAAYHAETILRTNFGEIYNIGRWQLYNDPDVDAFVPALQYNAILDSRTRPNHAAMDGKIFAKKDPILSIWRLPAGYNCRCIWVAVTSNMQYSVSEKPNVSPDRGFGGVFDERRA